MRASALGYALPALVASSLSAQQPAAASPTSGSGNDTSLVARRPQPVREYLCWQPPIPGTPETIIPGDPGTPSMGDFPGTPPTPPIIIPGTPEIPGYWYICW